MLLNFAGSKLRKTPRPASFAFVFSLDARPPVSSWIPSRNVTKCSLDWSTTFYGVERRLYRDNVKMLKFVVFVSSWPSFVTPWLIGLRKRCTCIYSTSENHNRVHINIEKPSTATFWWFPLIILSSDKNALPCSINRRTGFTRCGTSYRTHCNLFTHDVVDKTTLFVKGGHFSFCRISSILQTKRRILTALSSSYMTFIVSDDH